MHQNKWHTISNWKSVEKGYTRENGFESQWKQFCVKKEIQELFPSFLTHIPYGFQAKTLEREMTLLTNFIKNKSFRFSLLGSNHISMSRCTILGLIWIQAVVVQQHKKFLIPTQVDLALRIPVGCRFDRLLSITYSCIFRHSSLAGKNLSPSVVQRGERNKKKHGNSGRKKNWI